jgi:hypothetical protein
MPARCLKNDAVSSRPKSASFIRHVRSFVQKNGVIGIWRVRHSPIHWRVTARLPPARSDMVCPTRPAFALRRRACCSAMGIGQRWYDDPPSATRKSCAAARWAVSRAQTGGTLMLADLIETTCRWVPIWNAGKTGMRSAVAGARTDA